MQRCPTCHNAFSNKRAHACDSGDLARAVRELAARVDLQGRQLEAQERQLEAQERQLAAQKRQVDELVNEAKRGASLLPDAPPLVFVEADMLSLVQVGLKAFVRRHRWPLSALGKAVFFCEAGEWVALTPVLMNRLAGDVMKQLSILLMAYVKAHGLLDHDPDGRYLEYSQAIHEMEPGQLKRAILDSST